MKFVTWSRVITGTLLATLVLTGGVAAQDTAKKTQPHQYHHYQIADPGTFGGPQSFQQLGGTLGTVGVLNNRGAFGGSADTSAIDPICLNHPPDCYASHGFVFQNGAKTDLGLLPDGINSQVNWVSANGLLAGNADNTHTDPLLGNPFQIRGTFWGHDRVITDIGALPGTYFAGPIGVNSRGEVVGAAMNTIPDSNSILGFGYQTRAFYWKDGVMQDLGTLGTGTDALAGLINERGQVIGWSYTNAIPTANCANNNFNYTFPLTTGSFIWDKHNGMRDIGGLGGTCTVASDINNRGQIVGASALTGDSLMHSFVWDAATGITDLMGPSNGSLGLAYAINDGGQIVGVVCDAVTCYAALWQKSGGKWQDTDLGIFAVGDCPNATSINASAQVVGTDYCNGLPFLSEDGANIVDLNTLVPSNSGLQLNEVGNINDRGEISINGWDGSNNHSVVLIPCDENHPDVSGCDYDLIDAETAAARSNQNPALHPAASTPGTRMPGMLNRFHFPKGRPTPGHAPAPVASPALSATSATTDWVVDRELVPQSGTTPSYCEVSPFGPTLNGTCIQSPSANMCTATFSGCPKGTPASAVGEYGCPAAIVAYSNIRCFSLPGFDVTSPALTPTTISAGSSATTTVTVSDYGGFSGSIALTCSVQPAPALAPTCLFRPNSVTAGTPSVLTVSTTAPTSASRSGAGSGLFYAFFLPFGGLFAIMVRFRSPEGRGKLAAAALACLLITGVVFQSACGAGKSPTPGTTAGSYIVTVTGTDSSGNLVSSTTMPPLYVQ